MLIAIIVIIILVNTVVEIVLYKGRKEKSLKIKTFDGSNQPYHPSVVYDGQNRFTNNYFMAITPYPIGSRIYRDRWECPCVYQSKDGLEWFQPENLKNPLDDLNDEEIARKCYFSDTHLLVNTDLNQLECWYRYVERDGRQGHEKVFRKVSGNGDCWSERELVIDLDSEKHRQNLGGSVVSPSVVYSFGDYHIWYVNKSKYQRNRKILRSRMNDSGEWSEAIECELSGKECDPWHIDIQFMDNEYYMTIYDLAEVLSIWSSKDGIEFNWVFDVLKPKRGTFYWHGLYRACLLKDSGQYCLYFSCDDYSRCRIGVMQGSTIKNLKMCKIVNGDEKQPLSEYFYLRYMKSPVDMLIGYLYKMKRTIVEFGKKQ